MKKQRKQNILSAIIMVLFIAVIVMVASIAYEEIINMQKQPAQNTGAGIEAEKEDDVENNNVEENKATLEEEEKVKEEKQEVLQEEKQEELPEENETTEKPVEDKKETVGEEEKSSENEKDTAKSNEEKAIDLARKEWGNDDSVTFNIVDKNGSKYRVAVIGAETETLTWYEVNTETWEISEF